MTEQNKNEEGLKGIKGGHEGRGKRKQVKLEGDANKIYVASTLKDIAVFFP